MRYLPLAGIAAALLASSITSASAQNVTSWVASNGLDSADCSRATPCATFAGALSKTVDAGNIHCVDSGSFGNAGGTGLTITKGIEIDCRSQLATVEFSGTTGLVINVPATGNGANQSVTLRGLVITGRLGSGQKANTVGVRILSAQNVSLNNVLVEQFNLQGILDVRTLASNSSLQLTNMSVAGCNAAGIVAAMTPGNFFANVVLNEVYSGYNAFGIAVAAGNRARITNSHFPYNGTGIASDPGGQIALAKSIISYSSGSAIASGGTTTVADNDISFVNTVYSGGGFIYTTGNNRLFFNSSVGVAPTQLPASTDRGQQ